MAEFVISDTHFLHKAIIGYENRPFKDVAEMTKELIKNWNSVVKKEDTVYHLGDVAFANKFDTSYIISQLNGKKVLIMGNHDRGRSENWWLEAGFDVVSKFPIIYNGYAIMSHEPVYLNDSMPYINIHGHLHSQKLENPGYINVGVENINYTPKLLSEILEPLKEIYGNDTK